MTDQLSLQVVEDESALLFTPDERLKKYTAAQAAELERLHTAVLMLLPSWPIETIAKELHLSTRTVRALAAREAEKVAGFGKNFAEMLMRTGARWVALARTKEGEASFRDLNIGAGIVMDHARALLMMGQVEGESVTKEDQDHVAAAEALRKLMRQAPPADAMSTGPELKDSQLQGGVAADGTDQAGELGPVLSGAEGEGGGSGPVRSEILPMDSREGGLATNEPGH